MKKGLSEVIMIVDRSGSMANIKHDVEGGLKSFIKKQSKEPGDCRVSLYQFDDKYETVFENRDISDVESIKIEPRGWTALLDAIGRTITTVGQRLAETTESKRPEHVIVVVLSDGQENHSREYTRAKIKEMVTHQTDKYAWTFTFLGCNQDALLTGGDLGYLRSNSLSFMASAAGVSNTFDALSSGVKCMRAGGFVGYTDEQRNLAMSS